ncbi:MAG: hypothetical protein A2370_02530 [Candidatus Vogelbacteria bacterium RIFOXYB1_FULL_42_16]|uniref:Uncharacterized protein n=2 Tax=Candidatus Vogeliibacteriota TaxID=1817922 RepID=A0A1G2QCM9_9BACT|nr:MAG: hypothetical protein A2370_02530 [Candidatus Vogelbacteria bacterium RIFOXYB1_FULL_42_16]OHA59000.1 MAG: hypothetical protein A2607_02055 [Candidatus Vogelbacteria bacterium RIFOXYD1_FULL_42_15]
MSRCHLDIKNEKLFDKICDWCIITIRQGVQVVEAKKQQEETQDMNVLFSSSRSNYYFLMSDDANTAPSTA